MARAAKEGLDGADIYSGCCTLKIEYAKVSSQILHISRFLIFLYSTFLYSTLSSTLNKKSFWKIFVYQVVTHPPSTLFWLTASKTLSPFKILSLSLSLSSSFFPCCFFPPGHLIEMLTFFTSVHGGLSGRDHDRRRGATSFFFFLCSFCYGAESILSYLTPFTSVSVFFPLSRSFRLTASPPLIQVHETPATH